MLTLPCIIILLRVPPFYELIFNHVVFQNSKADVNAAFAMTVDISDNYTVKVPPTLLVGGGSTRAVSALCWFIVISCCCFPIVYQ